MPSDNGGPGLLDKLRSVASAKLDEKYAESQRARAMAAQADVLADRLEASVKRVTDTNTWIPVEGDFRHMTREDRDDLREKSQKAALRQPLIVGYIRTMLRFVMGDGPDLRAATEDDGLNDTLDAWWNRVAEVNGWQGLEDEIARRTWRDGETFIHQQVQRTEGPIPEWKPAREVIRRLRRNDIMLDELEPPTVERGMTFFRLRPPSKIADPRGKIGDGIITAGSDAQTVLGYVWADGTDDGQIIPADEMHHIKIRADSDMLRGRSQLEPLLKRNKQYEDWLEYRIMLNLARTAVVLIKKFESATGSQVNNIRSQQEDERGTQVNDRKQKMLKPLSTIHSQGIDYEFKTPNLQASDARHDGRKIQLDMSAASGIAEFMLSGDSSNANYSSTLVAESPTMREFQSWRDFFAPHFKAQWRVAMANAREFGAIDIPEDAELAVKLDWPTMEMRDEKEHAEAQMIRFNAGILSKESWARDAGIDWESEKERLSQEQSEFMDFEPPPEGEGE